RNGLTAYTYSPRGPGFLAPVARRSFCSLDTSVGVSGPHDFAVRSSAVRPHEEIMRVAVASIASRPTFRDDSAYAPPAGAGPAHHASDFGKSQVNFRKTEFDPIAACWRDGQLAHGRSVIRSCVR